MIDGNPRAGRGRRHAIALGAALCALAAVAGAPAQAAPPADAVVAALAMEQGRHCSVARARDADGRVTATVRGDFCDGRGFLSAVLAALAADGAPAARLDIGLDIQVQALAGFNNETLRDVSLRLSAHGGEIREFALAAKLDGRDVVGTLRSAHDGRRIIRLEAADAGALLRLTGVYRRVRGGRLVVEMFAAGADGVARNGVATLYAFSIADEPGLRPLARLLFGRRRAGHARFVFTPLRVAFKSRPGHVTVIEGLFWGYPATGTLSGDIDLAHDKLDLDGTMLPAAQFSPDLPLFPPLSGSSLALYGSRFKIAGPLSAAVLRLDPLSAVAPDFLRRMIEYKPGGDRLAP